MLRALIDVLLACTRYGKVCVVPVLLLTFTWLFWQSNIRDRGYVSPKEFYVENSDASATDVDGSTIGTIDDSIVRFSNALGGKDYALENDDAASSTNRSIGDAADSALTFATAVNFDKTITHTGNVGLTQEPHQNAASKLSNKSRARLPRPDEVFYTTLQPGTRMCWDPSNGMLAHPQSANLEDGLAILTAISPDMIRFATYSNYLFSVRRQGFEHVLQLPLRPLDRNLPEDVFWERRVEAYVQYLAKLPSGLTLIMMDNLDMLVLAPPSVILQAFQSMQADVVFGAEMLCDTDACRNHVGLRMFMESKASKHKIKFLNAGNVIGRAGALHSLFTKVLHTMRQLKVDDQAGIVQVWYRTPDILTLDYESRIFGVVPQTCKQFHRVWVIEEMPDSNTFRLRNRQTRNLPSIVHFAGMRLADPGFYANPDFKLNPCQAFAASLYDKIGEGFHPSAGQIALKRPRIVVSLTTTPMRLQLLKSTLVSLLQQFLSPSIVYLNIPRYSKRFRQAYQVPVWMKDLDVVVNWCEDLGPATKLLPTLLLETDPDTLLITADDDMVYKPTMFTDLVRHMLGWPHAAYNYAGQLVEESSDRALYGKSVAVRSADVESYHVQPVAVDILEAFLGVIYRRDFFDSSIMDIADECWSTDDIQISQHLAKKGIPRIKLPQKAEDRAEPSEADTVTPLRSGNVFGDRANDRCAATHLLTFKSMWLSQPQACPIRFNSLNVTSKGASNMIYTLDKAVSFDSDRGVCAMGRPTIDYRARVMFQGQYMSMSSMLVPPSRHSFGVSITRFGKVCLHQVGSYKHFRCITTKEQVHVRRNRAYFFIFQTDGNLCLYDGYSPSNNHGLIWCWSEAKEECNSGGCLLEMCDDLVLRIWTGTQLIDVDWNRPLPNNISDINMSNPCSYSAQQAPGTFRVEQALEKGWSMTSQYRLASKRHSIFAFMDSVGRLCSARVDQSSSIQLCSCYPSDTVGDFQNSLEQPRITDGVNDVQVHREGFIVFNPDGKLCAYRGREPMAQWEVEAEGVLWCKQVMECSAQPCVLEVGAYGAMVMRTLTGQFASLATEGSCTVMSKSG